MPRHPSILEWCEALGLDAGDGSGDMDWSDDDVDDVIDAWSEILPDLDLTPLDVMSRLRRVGSAAAHSTARGGHGDVSSRGLGTKSIHRDRLRMA